MVLSHEEIAAAISRLSPEQQAEAAQHALALYGRTLMMTYYKQCKLVQARDASWGNQYARIPEGDPSTPITVHEIHSFEVEVLRESGSS